jgi:hypothetical protein
MKYIKPFWNDPRVLFSAVFVLWIATTVHQEYKLFQVENHCEEIEAMCDHNFREVILLNEAIYSNVREDHG